ncbi:hypothetical protein M427DRAFT_54927 [Gonapodya prolifera JEL478]|uniref:Uncharacterized protein n=1 Tax=Gonapodya prolifera (strain JEL478) TaxID=1344416 RepID=A0A139AL86_GONPJ|nr:hypothetical protein M427DRAFT_54927 [Gonapodya prolifera JEL478]|eukprot:KXS17273.1 hypothetical protein M427DRAFT_54927 [Gonapodya prolifera JEL478]
MTAILAVPNSHAHQKVQSAKVRGTGTRPSEEGLGIEGNHPASHFPSSTSLRKSLSVFEILNAALPSRHSRIMHQSKTLRDSVGPRSDC